MESFFRVIKTSIGFGSQNILTIKMSMTICRLLINFTNTLVPDQARRDVGPDLEPNYLILLWYSDSIFLNSFEKNVTNCRRLKKFTNRLVQDQARQKVVPDLESNRLTP